MRDCNAFALTRVLCFYFHSPALRVLVVKAFTDTVCVSAKTLIMLVHRLIVSLTCFSARFRCLNICPLIDKAFFCIYFQGTFAC